jgi:tetratricopeptide (TPR) repeat protein
MGDVYEAQQQAPHRRVALKLIRADRHSPQALARFQLEAEVLGQLRHPGIAQVFEAGEAQQPGRAARAFIAMELVEGQTLEEFVLARKLSLRARLELLARVCDAVAHAHQHGIIHRDLKPGNILVVELEETDGASDDLRAQPKVLDFGVARIADPGRGEFGQETRDGQVVGTLAYMAPEQMSGSRSAIDIRADVYSLGVVLYELLAGVPAHRLEGLSLPEAVLELRDRAPVRLGTLRHELRGDVETIVARAMSKDRERRYASAADLGADLRRHLRGEPIQARADSRSYVIGRQLRLHWRASAAGAAFVGLLAVFAAVSSVQAAHNRRIAADEQAASARAQAQQHQAERARVEAEQLNALLLRLFKSAHTHRGNDAELLVRDLLDEFTVDIAAQLADQPVILARLLSTLGEANRSISRPVQAADLFQRALAVLDESNGEAHDIARTTVALGTALLGARELDRAQIVLERGLTLHAGLDAACRACVARGFVALARVHRNLDRPEAARSALLEARDAAACPPFVDALLHAEVLTASAELESNQANPAGAEALLRQALFLLRSMPEPPDAEMHEALSKLAHSRRILGDLEESESLARESIAKFIPSHGSEHPGLAMHLNALALTLHERGRTQEAHGILLHALDLLRDSGAPARENTLTIQSNLALVLRSLGQHDAALALYESVLAERIALHGERSRFVALDHSNLGIVLYSRGSYDKAEQHLRAAIAIHREMGGEHGELANTMLYLGVLLEKIERLEEALEAYAESLDLHRRYLGEQHLRTFRSTRKVGEMLLALGRPAKAQAYFVRAIDLAQDPNIGKPGDEAAMTTRLARCCVELEQLEQAETWDRRALDLWRAARPAEHIDVAQALCNLGRSLCQVGRYEESQSLLRESLALFDGLQTAGARRWPPTAWLGKSLICAGESSAGEALLLEAAQGLVGQSAVAAYMRRDVFELLVQHYEVTGREDLARPWRVRLAE